MSDSTTIESLLGPPQSANELSPIEQFDADQKRLKRQQFLQTQQNAQSIDPARQAKAIGVAKERGVPVGVAYDNLDQYSAQKPGPDFDALLAKAPTTAKLVSDPVAGPVATPDHKELSDIEQNLAAFSYLRGLDKPKPPQPILDQVFGTGSMYLTPEQQAAEQATRVKAATEAVQVQTEAERQANIIADNERKWREQVDPNFINGGQNYNPASDLTKVTAAGQVADAKDALKLAQTTPPNQKAAAAYANTVIRTLAGFGISSAQGLSALADSLQYYAPIGSTPLDKNGRSGATQFFADLNDYVSQLFPEDKGRAQDLGQRTTGAVASTLPFLAGGVGVKALGQSPEWFAGVFGALQQAGQGEADAVANGAGIDTKNITTWLNLFLGATEAVPIEALFATASAGSKGLGQFLAATASNAAIEATQNVVQQVPADIWAKTMYDPKRDVWGNALEAGKMGGLAGSLFGSVAHLVSSSAEDNHQKLIAIGDAVGKARISEIAPEILDEHIAQLKKTGAAPEHVTAPSEAVDTLFQGVDGDALQKFPGTVRSLQEARATGAEVTIPTEELVRLGKLKGYQNFAADVRVGDDMTLNEATKLRDEIGNFVKEQDTAGSQPSQDESPIFQNIRDQLVAAGNSPEVATAQARLFDAMLTNHAERSGIPAADLARRYGVEISNSAVEAAGQTTLAQGAAPVFNEPAIQIDGQVLKASDFFPNWPKGDRPEGGGGMSVADEQALEPKDLGPGMPEDPFWGHTDLLHIASEKFGAEKVRQQIEVDPENGFGFVNDRGEFRNLKTPQVTTLNQGVIADVVNRIKEVIAAARGKGHAPQKAVITPVSPWLAREADAHGLYIQGFSHVIDGSAVRHIFSEHGNAKTERSRGQIAITEADLENIPQVVAAPDAVGFGVKTRLGRDAIVYLKKMPDGSVLYLEEARNKNKELAALSIRKYPATSNNPAEFLLSHAQGDGGDAFIVVTPPANVNEAPSGASSASGTTLDQGGKDVRGSISFGPLRDKFRITLTEKANLSTFLHEGGHFFLEVLQDLVQRGEASAQQVADLKTLKRWMGIEDGKAIDVAGHEKFARTFEQFLMEGKAPSLALHAIFQKFKAWMIFVYKRLANVRGELNDEVRAVMDRLVASDAAIAEARAMVGWRGTPMSQEETGLTDAEYKAYVGEWTKANDAQSADADARIMLEAARELKKTWSDEKTKVTKEAEKALAETRGWKAWKLLEKGEGIEEYGRSSIKIDPDSIPKEWRRDTVGITAPADQGGMDLDMAAELLGFETGEQMLQAIGGAKLAQKAIPAKVRQIMVEKHGEMDAAQLSQEAMKAVHNTPTMDVLLTEFRALAAKANLKVGKDTKRLIRATAEERVAQIPVRKLEPSKWRRAEVKAAEEAGKLAAKGRDMEAALAKRRQLMAAAMAKASLEAQDRASAIKDYLATFVTNRRRAALGKAGDAYLDQVDGILEAVQLKEVSLKAIKARQGLDEFVKEQEAAGEPVFISSETRDLLGRKNYTEMTLEELEGVHDAVKNLWTVAKEINTVRREGEKIALENALAEITKETEETLPLKKQRDHLNPGRIDKMMAGLGRYHAGNLKIEFALDWLGKTAHSLIFQPIANAGHESWKLHRDLTAPFMDKLRNMPKEQRQRWNTKRQFLNYPIPLKGANIWMIALNMGNAGNKEKMLAGYGWTESQVMAELSTFMTKEDWDLAQETLDTIEKMWPKMEAVMKRATGLSPPKVEATPIETPFGTYRGGYFPVVYDTAIDARMDDKLDSSISPEEMFSKRFTAFVINNGFTKGRTANVGKLLFSPDVIAEHLGEVIHYATHYDAVKQADKIIRSPAFKALVKDHLGTAVYAEMKQWLKDVATNTTRSDRQAKAGDWALRWARNSAQLASLGLNIKSALKQPLGIMTTLDAIGSKHWAIGIQKAWLSPSAVQNWKDAFAKSKELGPLVKGYDRDLAAISRAYADNIGSRAHQGLYQLAFAPISVMQSVANVAAWHGGYSQATEQGMSEQEAIDFADKVVRTTQGSGALKDLSGMQRGGEANKFFTMFYSYFGVLYNRLADVEVRNGGVKNLHKRIGRYTVLLLLPELLNTLFDDGWGQMFPPDNKKDEKDGGPWSFLTRLALNTVDSTINTMPVVRDAYTAATAVVSGTRVRTPPALGGVVKAIAGAKAAVDLFEGKDMTRAKGRNLAALVSIVTGTPVYGAYRIIDDLFGSKIFDE